MLKIAIIDYGMGNIESVANAFKQLDTQFFVANTSAQLKMASAVVLPGVGAFPAAMKNLQNTGLDDALYESVVVQQKPFLGICLGLQLIAKDSTEQTFSMGLGWINGHVTRLDRHENLPVPHVGWNEVVRTRQSVLFHQISENSHFFFDHSYHLECEIENIAAICDYGKARVASIEKGHIFAVQFHPEKSQRNGLKLLRNFLNFTQTN